MCCVKKHLSRLFARPVCERAHVGTPCTAGGCGLHRVPALLRSLETVPRDQSASRSPWGTCPVPMGTPCPYGGSCPTACSLQGLILPWLQQGLGQIPTELCLGESPSAWDLSIASRHGAAGSPQCARVPVWELIPATSARLFAMPGVSGCVEGTAGCAGDTCVRGGWRVPGLPVQGSTCARRLLRPVCACTRVSSAASEAPGGDKWHWGLQRAPQLWDLGSRQVKVGVLAGIYQFWCGHVQSSTEGEMLGEERGVFASLPGRMISQGNDAGGERGGKRSCGAGWGERHAAPDLISQTLQIKATCFGPGSRKPSPEQTEHQATGRKTNRIRHQPPSAPTRPSL